MQDFYQISQDNIRTDDTRLPVIISAILIYSCIIVINPVLLKCLKFLIPLIKGALRHRGPAFIDVVSPCVTFNNHEGSTKSYTYFREHADVTPIDFVPMREEIRTSYAPGATQDVCMHDGSVIRLHKHDDEYDIEDPQSALQAIAYHQKSGRVLTGLLYMDRDAQELHEILETTRRPLNTLTEKELCPGTKVLDSINAGLR